MPSRQVAMFRIVYFFDSAGGAAERVHRDYTLSLRWFQQKNENVIYYYVFLAAGRVCFVVVVTKQRTTIEAMS